MLSKCPECELPVSDKAFICPHCGYPLKEDALAKTKPKTKKKRIRLPNGFGQISEIKNSNLRKPFRAMVTVGKDQHGKPICKPLRPNAYFETYNDAYAALVEFNRNPYTLSEKMTMKELYERWLEAYTKENPKRNMSGITAAWNYCSIVYDLQVIEIRPRHLKACFENGTAMVHGKEAPPTANVKQRMKMLFNQMLDYAVEYELIEKNYIKTFKLSKTISKELVKKSDIHKPYTDKEMQLLWNNAGNSIAADMILVQCYSGWRPNELCNLELENINLDEGYFISGSKTEAGLDRKVPIHSKIEWIVKNHYQKSKDLGGSFLFTKETKPQKITPSAYRHAITGFFKQAEIETDHIPHDGRVHFVTQAKKYNVDEYAIKRIVGHTIKDITEAVYTKRDFDWLRSEIEKIK